MFYSSSCLKRGILFHSLREKPDIEGIYYLSILHTNYTIILQPTVYLSIITNRQWVWKIPFLRKKIELFFKYYFYPHLYQTLYLIIMDALFQRFIARGGIHFQQHQHDAVSWCIANENATEPVTGVRGGFIADEMGLGKTISIIALIVCNFRLYKKTLIVLPNILLQQWRHEIFRTTGHQPLIYHGSAKKKILLNHLNSATIVLTTYSAIALSLRRPTQNPLHLVQWDRLVFDEAHHLRNRNSRFIGARALNARARWLVSGTPIQNKKRDFFNMCSVLGLPASFYTDSSKNPILFSNHVLRRTKSHVGIQFTSLQQHSKLVHWNDTNEHNLSVDIHNALAASSEKLKFILKARQSCILPALLDPTLHSSSKLNAVIDAILLNKHNGNGKLVFCHFHQEIDFIFNKITLNNIPVARFDGRLSIKQRANLLLSPPTVLILQIQTASEGLNLQHHFSEIYFVSPHWNPAVQDQAVARCHRIGQTKPVSVYNYAMNTLLPTLPLPLTEPQQIDNIEQHILLTQTNKKLLSDTHFYKHT